jgi:CHAT domain-containing protein
MLVTTPRVDPGYWLDDGPPIAYVASGSALKWCRERREAVVRNVTDYDVVAVGDPVFSRSRDASAATVYGDLPPLPGSREEVAAIARVVPRVATALGEDATEARVADLAPKGRFLHLATHYLPRETETASYSALALTAPKSPSSREDGFLRLSELFEHWGGKLDGCELVVLSACSTQRGFIQKDEAPLAMPLGFFYAGCPAVIASLWPVHDPSTASLMASFYESLFAKPSGGEPAPTKLAAFTAARKRIRKLHPDPASWAAFVYMGDPR